MRTIWNRVDVYLGRNVNIPVPLSKDTKGLVFGSTMLLSVAPNQDFMTTKEMMMVMPFINEIETRVVVKEVTYNEFYKWNWTVEEKCNGSWRIAYEIGTFESIHGYCLTKRGAIRKGYRKLKRFRTDLLAEEVEKNRRDEIKDKEPIYIYTAKDRNA